MGDEDAVETEGEMRVGALALLDALGFKGIWREHTPSDVLRRMEELERRTRTFPDMFTDMASTNLQKVKTRVLFVSDSVFIAAWPGNDPRYVADAEDCVEAVQLMTLVLVWHALQDGIAFRYRGVIGYGEYAVANESHFIVGPAVDEVAVLEREAEGAFIWTAPSALDLSSWGLGLTKLYDVPMKGGRRFQTEVLNPFWIRTRTQADKIEQALLGIPDPRLDVAIKRQNVGAFLKHVRAEQDRTNDWKPEAD
jgi:hypothetical protein